MTASVMRLGVVLTGLVLGACSSNTTMLEETPPATTSDLSGVTAKGLVSNGIVEICPSGAASGAASCRSARTGADGTYSITVEQPFAVPAIVTLTADDETQIKCDVVGGCGETAFGSFFAAPADFFMRTVVPTLSSEPVSAPVTPFTEAVVARASDAGQVNATTVAAARNLVSAALGLTGAVDVLGLTPVDVTNPAALAAAGAQQHDYSVFLSGVAAADPANPTAAVAALRTAFVDGLPQQAYQALVTNTQAQSAGLQSPQRAGLVAVAEAQAAATGPEGFTPPPPANADAVDQAKLAVAQLRMLFNDLSNLEAPLDAFAPQVEAAAAAANSNAGLLAAVFDVIDLTFRDLARLQPEGDGSCFSAPQTLTDERLDVNVTVTCSADSEPAQRTLSVSGTVASYAVENLNLVVTENVYALLLDNPDAPPVSEPGEGTEPIAFNITLDEIRQTEGPEARFVISDGAITLDIDRGALFDLVDTEDLGVIRSIRLDVLARAEFAVPEPEGSAFFEGEFRVAATSASAEAEPSLDTLRFAGSIGVNEAEALASIEFMPDAEAAGPEGFKGRLTVTLNTSGIPNVPPLKVVATGRFLQFVDDGDAIEAEAVLTLLRDDAQAVRVQFIGGDRFDAERLDLDTRVVVTVGTGGSGVTLTYREVNGDEIAGRITVGNDEVALVSSPRGSNALLIRYSDGSFESVF